MNLRWRAGVGVALVATATWGASVARAGEPIIVPSEKPKTTPQAPNNKPIPRDVFRFGDKLTPPPAFDVMTVPIAPNTTPLDPREQKRRKLERLERENWMMVGKGELQAEEEERHFLNVREYSLDGIEKEDERGNLMFRNLNKDGNQRMPGQFRSPDDKSKGAQLLLQRRAAEDEEETRRNAADEPKQGAHIAGELNLKKMFEPLEGGSSLAPAFNKSDLLQNLLNGGASREALRERQERREEFQRFLDRGSAPALSGSSDPINQPFDFTRQPFNPTMPQPLGGGTVGGGSFGQAPPIVRPGSSLGGNVPTAFAGSSTPAGFSAGPLVSPQPESRGPAKPTLKFDPPRRKF